ncbi:MAG: dihydrofolate reductase family protein [Pseudomonadota bacterium]
MSRPQVSVFIAATIDGFIAREDGSIDFLDCVSTPGEDYGFHAFADSVDAVVLGRKTYDTVLGFSQWPFPTKRVVVLTHHAIDARHGEYAHGGKLAPLFRQLHADGIRHVYLDGGHAIRHGLAENLIDEMTIATIPVLLGSGRPLFGAGIPVSTWDLVDTRSFASGLVQCRWKARDLPPA